MNYRGKRMIEPLYRMSVKGMELEVEDRNGNKETFSSVDEVSNLLHCSKTYVYRALRTGKEIVGCKVRVIEQ